MTADSVRELRIKSRLQRGEFCLELDERLPLRGITALFGRSGCGKTTLLRIVAGLERSPDSHVSFAGQHWQQGKRFVPPEQRRAGLVFQEHSLLPHLSVQDNLLYGYRRTPESLRRLQPDEIIAMLDIAELLPRRIDQLSGGQRQRISLGRALLSSPQLLLLDEPLAALDTQARREIMPFLGKLAKQTGVPALLVTHAPDEVQRLADDVVFMHEGRISHIESLQQALARADSPLFRDEGAASVLQGSLHTDSSGQAIFGNQQLKLVVQARHLPDKQADTTTRIRIQARDVSIALQEIPGISIQNQLPASLSAIKRTEQSCLLTLQLGDGQPLLAEVTARAADRLGLTPGLKVFALIKTAALLP